MTELFKFRLQECSITVAEYCDSQARAMAHRYLLRNGVPNAEAKKVFDADVERMDYIFSVEAACPFCGTAMKRPSDDLPHDLDCTYTYYRCPQCRAAVQTTVYPPEVDVDEELEDGDEKME